MPTQLRADVFAKIRKDLQRQIIPDLLKRMALAGRAAVLSESPGGLGVQIAVEATRSRAFSAGRDTSDKIRAYVGAYDRVAELWKTRQEFDKAMAAFGVV